MDFTGDGKADILSGCYWSQDPNCPDGDPQAGYFYILAGTGGENFSTATPLVNAKGKPLLNVPLSRERLENYDVNNIEPANISTAQFAVDYDADGDLDLVGGAGDNRFFLHLNSADSPSDAPVFADLAVALDVVSPDDRTGPHMVDWDGDGDLDLLTGSSSGSVFLSINEGSPSEPKWTDFEFLIKGESLGRQSADNEGKIKPGLYVRVCVTDFNRDGKLDLLTGDATTITTTPEGVSEKQAQQMEKEHEAEWQPLLEAKNQIQERLRKKYEKELKQFEKAVNANKKAAEQGLVGDTDIYDIVADFQKELRTETQGIQAQIAALRKKKKQFLTETMTGHVWVYLQK